VPPTKTLSIALQLDQGNVRAGLGQTATELSSFDKKLGQVGDSAGRGFGQASKHVSTFRAGLGQAAQDVGKVGDKITIGLTLPLVAAGGAAVKLSNDFETAFAQMVGLAGVPAGEVEQLKKQVLDLSGQTAQAPNDLAKALYFVESAGLHGKDALDALTVSAKGAQAGLGETEGVADALTSVLSAYGTANLSAAQAGDILVAAIRDGKAEASAMVPELGKLLAPATALKIPFNDLAAGFAYLSRTMPAAEAATAWAAVMRGLLNPSTQAADALQNVGISVQALQQSVAQNGVLPTLQMLQDKLGGNSMALNQVFEDSRAFIGAQALMTNGGRDAAVVFDDTAHSVGSLAKAQDAVSGTSANSMKQALADVQIALIKAGDAIGPFVSTVAAGAADVATAFAALPAPAQNALLAFAALVAISGPLMSAVGRVGKTIDTVSDAWRSLMALRGADTFTAGTAAAAAESQALTGLAAAEGEAAIAASGLGAGQQVVTDEMIAAALAEGEASLAASGLAVSESAAAAAATEMGAASAAAGVGVGAALGPIGLLGAAAGGLVLALGLVGGGEHNAAVDAADFTGALKDQNGVLDENVDKVSAHALAQDAGARSAAEAGVSYKTMFDAIRTGTDDFGGYSRAVEHYSQITDGTLGEALAHAGANSTDFGRQLIWLADHGFDKGKLGDYINTIEGLHNKYVDAKTATDAETSALGGQAKTAETASGTIDALNTSLEDLTTMQGGLVELGSQLVQSMGKQYDAMLAPQKAADAYKQSTNDLIDTLHKETFTLDDSDSAHGRWNEHALKNIAAAQQLGGSISDLIQQTYEHTHSVEAAVQAGEIYVADLTNQLHAAGFTEDQVRQLIETMHLTPAEIRTAFSTNALEQQLAIIKYQQTLGTLPPDVRTLIEAELRNGDIDRANETLNNFIDKKRVVHIGVEQEFSLPGSNIKVRAAGGPVQAGHPYVVTERGDEAFIGSKSSMLLRGRGPQLWVAPADGEIVPNHMLRQVADGTSGAGAAIAAAQAHAGALASAHDVLAGSGTGALVAAEASMSNSDAAQAMQETERQLSQLAAAYVNVAEVAGQAAADQLAASNLTADEFTDAAQRIVQGARDQAAAEKQAAEDAKRAAEEQQRAAEEVARTHMAINDARFQLGLVSQAERLGVLSKRLGQVSQDSLEYYQILGQIQSLQSNVAQEHMAEHDVQFQVGDLDAGTYRQMLQARLDATDKYSADYKKAWDDLRSFDQAQAAAQEKINQERAQQVKDQQDLEDRLYEHGQMSTEQYLVVLQKRLAAEEAAGHKSSATWFQISDDIAAAQKKIVDDTSTSAQEFADAIDKMTRPLSGAFTANLGFLDSLQRMVDQIHEAGGSVDELTTKGRQDLSAIASAVQSAEENAVARYTKTGDLAGSTQLLQQNLDSIKASLTAQGVSGADVDKLFGQLGVADSEVQSLLTLPHGGGGAGTVVQGDQTNVGTQNINLAFHLGSVGDAIDADMQRMIAQVAISTARNVARGVAA
jgi:TP901 family phage tail tape measure protein